MMNNNPAEIAALKSLSDIYSCIDRNQSFLLEAGATAANIANRINQKNKQDKR